MYACKQCGTGNPLDSSFCKKCGTALPADELADARVKLAEMLDEGNSLFTEGRTDEAMLIAEAAVTANPSSHMAYSLKGLCHERVGQIAEALECYEIAVGLNADSSLDKVKVAALRNRLAQRVTETPEPSRRSAAMIGVAAAVLFLVGGSLAAIGMNGKKDNGKIATNPPTLGTPNAPVQLNSQSSTTNPGSQPNQTPPSNGGQSVQAPATGGAGTAQQYDEPNLPQAPARTLPVPEGGAGFDPGPLKVVPEGPIGAPTIASRNDKQAPGIDPSPAPLQDNGNKTPEPTKAPDEEHGYINIQMAPKAPSTPGGSEQASDGNGAAAVLRAAQESYQVGNYDLAAKKYAQAASMGGGSPKLQQRLGDCYRNLGNTAKARAAYNHAITMYQSQIKKGVDVAGNQRGLDTCESALRVLGG